MTEPLSPEDIFGPDEKRDDEDQTAYVIRMAKKAGAIEYAARTAAPDAATMARIYRVAPGEDSEGETWMAAYADLAAICAAEHAAVPDARMLAEAMFNADPDAWKGRTDTDLLDDALDLAGELTRLAAPAHPAWWRGCDYGYAKGRVAAPDCCFKTHGIAGPCPFDPADYEPRVDDRGNHYLARRAAIPDAPTDAPLPWTRHGAYGQFIRDANGRDVASVPFTTGDERGPATEEDFIRAQDVAEFICAVAALTPSSQTPRRTPR